MSYCFHLPVVSTSAFTVTSIFLYSLALVGLTVMFVATGAVGWVYTAMAVALGSYFIYLAWRLKQQENRRNARKLYLYSLLYLGLLFVAVMVGSATGW